MGTASHRVRTLSLSVDGGYNPFKVRDFINKLDELINALWQ